MSEGQPVVIGRGPVVQVYAGPEGFGLASLNEAISRAELAHSHLWVAITYHHVQPEALVAGELLIDAENLLNMSVGCYVCEQSFTEPIAFMGCPGDPGLPPV